MKFKEINGHGDPATDVAVRMKLTALDGMCHPSCVTSVATSVIYT